MSLDARLRRLWRHHAQQELRGIAAAVVNGAATVIAVVEEEPGAYESSRLREAFGQYLEDRRLHLLIVVADTYEDLVRAWFTLVDGGPGRMTSVRTAARDAVLQIGVHGSSSSQQERAAGPVVGTAADREALRRLVPHEQIEFVAAGTPG